jgi:hypothetical protein
MLQSASGRLSRGLKPRFSEVSFPRLLMLLGKAAILLKLRSKNLEHMPSAR